MSEIWNSGETPQNGICFQYASYTDVGKRRVNEDSIRVVHGPELYGFFLCDGLGGHGMGDAASQFVISHIAARLPGEKDPEKFLKYVIDEAQLGLLEEQKRLHAEQKMKTTAVLMVTDLKKVAVGHVGDSRLYLFKHGKVKKRTLDHSVPQMMVLAHEIKEEEIRHHPERSLLLRVMGIPWDEPKYELMKPFRAAKYDAFLLCSDGFWELITESEMEACYAVASDTEDWLRKMQAIVSRNGQDVNMDNNSAIAVRVIRK